MANPLILLAAGFAVLALGNKRKTGKTSSSATDDEVVLEYNETTSDSDMPMLGLSNCFGTMYGGRARLSKNVLNLMDKSARAYVVPANGRYTWADSKGGVHTFVRGYTYLSAIGQVAAFNAALSMISGSDRSTLSVMTRSILKKIMPSCDWDVDLSPSYGHDSMSKDQYNLWTSVWYLVNAAAKQKKYRVGGKRPAYSLLGPAGGGTGVLVGRGFLDMPEVAEVGHLNLEPGRRVELIAGDYKPSELPRPPMFHAEPLYAYVVDASDGEPLVEILSTFQGKDVSPRFDHKHGFYAGRRIKLYSTGTTGIRRIFPPGIE